MVKCRQIRSCICLAALAGLGLSASAFADDAKALNPTRATTAQRQVVIYGQINPIVNRGPGTLLYSATTATPLVGNVRFNPGFGGPGGAGGVTNDVSIDDVPMLNATTQPQVSINSVAVGVRHAPSDPACNVNVFATHFTGDGSTAELLDAAPDLPLTLLGTQVKPVGGAAGFTTVELTYTPAVPVVINLNNDLFPGFGAVGIGLQFSGAGAENANHGWLCRFPDAGFANAQNAQQLFWVYDDDQTPPDDRGAFQFGDPTVDAAPSTFYIRLTGTIIGTSTVTGACCDTMTGHCALLSQATCEAMVETSYQGADSVCMPSPCGNQGACCESSGDCTLTLAIGCATGSLFVGENTTCAPGSCPAPSACCRIDASCRIMFPSICAAEGSLPFDAGVMCSPNPCPIALACCLPNGTCVFLIPTACAQSGASPEVGATCSPNLCPPPYACCLPGFVCLIASTASDCTTAGGSPLVRSTCAPQVCCPTPVVLAQPSDQLLITPQSITLSVQASHPAAISFQWQHDGVAIVGDPRAQGATSPTLTIVNTQPFDAGLYSVVMTSSCGSATTSSAAVVTLCTAPAVVSDPSSLSVPFGAPMVLSAEGDGPGTLNYRWRRNGTVLNDSGRVSGVHTPMLTIDPIEVADEALYDCTIFNECGESVTQTALVTVTCSSGPADCNNNGVCDIRDLAGGADLTAPSPVTGDRFGWSVATDGARVVVGARTQSTSGGAAAGAAHVFVRAGSGWSHMVELTAPDGAANEDFGSHVAIEGQWIAIAARRAAVGGQSQAGAVYLFRNNAGNWQFFQKITEPTPTLGANFGHGIDFSGDRLVVGSFQGNGTQPGSGVVYVYRFNTLNWAREATLIAPDGQAGDGLGISVAIHDPYLIAGAPYDSDTGITSGSAYVYFRGFSGWELQSKVLPRNRQPGQTFGELVAMSGDIAMVNCPRETVSGVTSAGAVYMFRRSDVRWSQQRRLIADPPQFNELFGFYITLDGGTAAVGGFNRTVDGTAGAGQVSIFKRSGNYWIRASRIDSPKPETSGWFGYALCAGGGQLAVGAFQGSAGLVAQAGWARAFDLSLLDCDKNMLPDVCEIADGFVIDGNGNGIPDGCESQFCRADFNDSGTVSVQDIFDFLAEYFQGILTADINNSGILTVQDLFDFLAVYFAGCP